MKVFNINDNEWVAAETQAEALAEWMGMMGYKPEDLDEDFSISEVSERDLKKLIFYLDIENPDSSTKRTFEEELKRRLNNREKFPQYFATSEY